MDYLKAYANYSDEALRFVLKDASEAAANMRAIGDYRAETKYLDQINDATTLLARRAAKAAAPRKATAPKNWVCQECGKRMTLKQAERATSQGCPKCNSSDIDLAR